MKLWKIGLIFMLMLLIVMPAAAQQAPPTIQPTDVPGTIEINPEQAAETVIETTTAVTEGTANVVNRLVDRLTQVPRSDFARILLVIGGVVLLIAGWSVYEFIILIAGFLIGASVAVSLVNESNTVLQLVGLLLGGLVGAALAAVLYYVAVFLIGAYLGIALISAVAVALTLTPVSSLVLLAAAFIGGIILLGLSFEFLILLAALLGAQMLALGLGLGAEWILIFFVVGIVIQLAATRYSGYEVRRRPSRMVYFPRRRRA